MQKISFILILSSILNYNLNAQPKDLAQKVKYVDEKYIIENADLSIAARHDYRFIARVLLNNGADVNELFDGTTALNIAIANKSIKVAIFLIKNGADINKANKKGYCPLHIAAICNSKEIAEILIENGADINQQNNFSKRTPLHFAVEFLAKDMIKLLVQNNADINIKDAFEYSPLCRLFRHSFFKNYKDSIRIAFFLLRNGADINSKDSSGFTLLHKAVLHGSSLLVEKLIEIGVDSTITDENGQTPLDWLKS